VRDNVDYSKNGREIMQIMLNIPDVIPQVIVDRILKQVESQLQYEKLFYRQ